MDRSRYFKYVSTSVISMLGLSAYVLADTFFVAQGVGEQGLAALNLALPLYALLTACGLLIGMGGATLCTLLHDKKIFAHAFALALFASFLFVGTALLFVTPLLRMMGADDTLLPYAVSYARTILLFAPAFLLNNLLLAFVRNDGAPRLSMLAMLTSSFGNVVLDYLFLFPLSMGMFGAAFATGLSAVLSLLILCSHVFRRKDHFRLARPSFQPALFQRILLIGAPSMITELASAILMLAFNITLMKTAGATAVAAYGIIANLSIIVSSLFTGIGQGSQPLLGETLRMENRHIHQRALLGYNCLLAVPLAVFCWLAGSYFAKPLAAVFAHPENLPLIDMTTHGIRIYFIAYPAMGLSMTITAYFAAIGNARQALALSLLRSTLLLLPLLAILSALWALDGIWATVPLTETLTAAVALALVQAARKKHST